MVVCIVGAPFSQRGVRQSRQGLGLELWHVAPHDGGAHAHSPVREDAEKHRGQQLEG